MVNSALQQFRSIGSPVAVVVAVRAAGKRSYSFSQFCAICFTITDFSIAFCAPRYKSSEEGEEANWNRMQESVARTGSSKSVAQIAAEAEEGSQ